MFRICLTPFAPDEFARRICFRHPHNNNRIKFTKTFTQFGVAHTALWILHANDKSICICMKSGRWSLRCNPLNKATHKTPVYPDIFVTLIKYFLCGHTLLHMPKDSCKWNCFDEVNILKPNLCRWCHKRLCLAVFILKSYFITYRKMLNVLYQQHFKRELLLKLEAFHLVCFLDIIVFKVNINNNKMGTRREKQIVHKVKGDRICYRMLSRSKASTTRPNPLTKFRMWIQILEWFLPSIVKLWIQLLDILGFNALSL